MISVPVLDATLALVNRVVGGGPKCVAPTV